MTDTPTYRQLAEEYNTSWLEYWDFLGDFVDMARPEGKTKLEEHLKLQYSKVRRAGVGLELRNI